MERLQAALSRARERRGEVAKDTTTAPRSRVDTTTRRNEHPDVQERWNALPRYEPNQKALTANRVVSYFGQRDATPYDMMRTKVVQLTRANGWKRVVITSPNPRCGKSTVAANLAFSLARHTDLRTIVVETDLRRPSLARILGAGTQHYFSKALAGLEPAENHMMCYGGNLIFATNETPAANPAELLQSERSNAVISEIDNTFKPDLMIFDTSPLLASDDTIGFMATADAAILVAAAELTSVDEIDRAESEIAEVTQVLGVVLNKVQFGLGPYGYDYKYDYQDA